MKVQDLQDLINGTVNNLTATQTALRNANSSFVNANDSIETAKKTLNEVKCNEM